MGGVEEEREGQRKTARAGGRVEWGGRARTRVAEEEHGGAADEADACWPLVLVRTHIENMDPVCHAVVGKAEPLRAEIGRVEN